jgi:hypothetical protein
VRYQLIHLYITSKWKSWSTILCLPRSKYSHQWWSNRWLLIYCMKNLLLLILFLFCAGVHCGSYKSFYNISNISYLNSRPPPFSFIPLPPFLEEFQQVSFFHLHTCMHSICTIFTLLHPFPTSSPKPVLPSYSPTL